MPFIRLLGYHRDRLGSVDYLTDNVSGKVASYIDYDEWGAPLKKYILKLGQRELDMAVEYTGHAWDAVLGVYFAQARMYDAANKRFMATDLVKGTVAYPMTLVPYVYVLDNPLKYVDTWGLIPTELEAAYMAKHIYDATQDDYKAVLPGGWILTNIVTNKEGLKIGEYERTVNNVTEYALVNKGTTPSLLIDWKNNIQQPLGLSADMRDSIRLSKEYYEKLKKCGGEVELTMVGHSKGGAEAAANAVASNVNAIVFNPATTFLSSYGLSAKTYTANMTVFVVQGEAVHGALWVLSKPIDTLVFLPAQYVSPLWEVWNFPLNAIKNHDIDAVIWGLLEKGYK